MAATDGASDGLAVAAAALLDRAGVEPGAALVPLAGGGNNRVYRVDSVPPRLLKAYFHHPLDRRDRLGTEFAVLRYAWAAGLRTIPEPVAADPTHRLGLYGFLPGRRLCPGEVSADAVGQALALVEALNAPALRAAASGLPVASEACFSLEAHLATVTRRLERLASIAPETPRHAEARAFLAGELASAWAAVERRTRAAAAGLGLEPEAELDPGDRCVSPSDFGFHNALIEDDGRLAFLDFEYAGWDDPAKLIGDFFSQVAVPVPMAFLPAFADRLAAMTSAPAWHRRRFDLLLPVYRVKWIAIILNEFLPVGAERRRFAGHDRDEDQRLTAQLVKARERLAQGNRVTRGEA